MYLYSAMADLAAEFNDHQLLTACRRLWRHLVTKRMYVTGGIGSSHANEGYTFDYDLPNETAYAETCAAIGLILFTHRLLQIDTAAPIAFTLALRIPSWCHAPEITLNGATVVVSPVLQKGYATLHREWQGGDKIELNLPMPVERVRAHPNVRANCSRVALQRGPLVYGLLYRPNGSKSEAATFKAIPYFAWDNRAPGEMLVWMRER